MELLTSLVIMFVVGSTYTIPDPEVDVQKVYYGSCSSFKNPAEIDYEEVIRATPEYEQVKKKKIEPGTGKYWILLSQASDRVVKCVGAVAGENGFDLIASLGYLEGLKKPIPSKNATQAVVDKVKSNGKEIPKNTPPPVVKRKKSGRH